MVLDLTAQRERPPDDGEALIRNIISYKKESADDAVTGQNVQHMIRRRIRRTVVESQCYQFILRISHMLII